MTEKIKTPERVFIMFSKEDVEELNQQAATGRYPVLGCFPKTMPGLTFEYETYAELAAQGPTPEGGRRIGVTPSEVT